jgi:hypothetical protein
VKEGTKMKALSPKHVLLRDGRPAADLRRALKAGIICRIAFLRRLGHFTRMADAINAIADADTKRVHGSRGEFGA